MGTAQLTFWEVIPEVTWPDAALTVTRSHGRDRVRMRNHFRRFFSYYSSSTVVHVTGLPEVTKCHGTPSRFTWLCACATGSCAISALVGPFYQKWRYETSLRSDPFGGSLGCTHAWSEVPLGCSLGRPRPISSMANGVFGHVV